jgi:hypothetical protein
VVEFVWLIEVDGYKEASDGFFLALGNWEIGAF